MDSLVSIKKASPPDSIMVASLGRKAFFEAFENASTPEDMKTYLDEAFSEENVYKQLSDLSNVFFICFVDSQPVGYAKLKKHSKFDGLKSANQIQLERIYAIRDFIGKKIGKRLMEKCLEFAKEEGFDHMWLGVWQKNDRAIRFYKSWNFEVVGYKKFVIGNEVNDDFVMALNLQDF